jgi:AcrR family transcriptional regulator
VTREAKFKYALKEMMLAQPLEDINVKSLCEKCGCHRQTFYYHYQDIFDLLASIFLNEEVAGLAEATTIKETLDALLAYAKANLAFLKSTYGSAAHDLVDDFFYNRIMTKLFLLLNESNKKNLGKDGNRNVARRYAKIVGDEFGYCLKEADITADAFEKSMRRFIDASLTLLLPALVEVSKEEKKK